MKRFTISASYPYDVLLGEGLLNNLGEYLLDVLPLCKICVITDSTANNLYGETVMESLTDAGYEATSIIFPTGEHSKNLSTYANILEAMANGGITRSDAILSLGGGVAGDLAGFAAATYMRGIKYIQVPTTLLSAIDASVGGKTGVNLIAGKNLAGVFWQPTLVVTDVKTFDTLSERRIKDGIAEAVKNAIISDSGLISQIEKKNYEYVVERCISIKKSLVEVDEKNEGLRQLLNFGHTLGHGIEKLSSYSITHGEAVAKGMVGEARAAFALGFSKLDLSVEIERILNGFGLDTSIPFSAEELYEQALMDKKISGGNINLVIPEVIGKCTLKKVSLLELERFIEAALPKPDLPEKN